MTVQGSVQEAQGFTALARVVKGSGAALVQADVSSVARRIFDPASTTPTTPIEGPTALTVSAVIFDTLQTDGYWTLDSTGYNFRDTYAGALLAEGGRTYRVEYTITTASLGIIRVEADVAVQPSLTA